MSSFWSSKVLPQKCCLGIVVGYFWCSTGKHLGPMLLLLVINDLPDIIPASTSDELYVDDKRNYIELMRIVSNYNLQEELACAKNLIEESNISLNHFYSISSQVYYVCSSEINVWIMELILESPSRVISHKQDLNTCMV